MVCAQGRPRDSRRPHQNERLETKLPPPAPRWGGRMGGEALVVESECVAGFTHQGTDSIVAEGYRPNSPVNCPPELLDWNTIGLHSVEKTHEADLWPPPRMVVCESGVEGP